jgi:hypothetical protein
MEDGMAPIEAMADLLDGRKNDLFEVWDFLDRVLVHECGTEGEALSWIERRYAKHFDRIRYLVHAPHNLLYLRPS